MLAGKHLLADQINDEHRREVHGGEEAHQQSIGNQEEDRHTCAEEGDQGQDIQEIVLLTPNNC